MGTVIKIIPSGQKITSKKLKSTDSFLFFHSLSL